MPISATSLVVLNDTSNLTSYATASTTPSAGKLVLCAVASSKASTPDLPTVSGCGLTWVQIATVLFDTVGTPTKRVTLFRALGTPSAGAVTASFGGVQQTGCNIFVSEFGPVDATGTNGSGAVVQSATNAIDAATSISVTLGAFARPENAAYGCEFTNLGSNSTVGSGFSLIARGGYGTPNHTGNTEFKASEDTGVDWTFASANAGAIAIEIDILVISCDGAGTMGHLTGAGSAELQFVASGVGALGHFSGAAAGEEQFVAAAAGTLRALSGAAQGELQLIGASAGALAHATGAGAAELQFVATSAGALGAQSGASSAELQFVAAAAGVLRALNGAAAGELAIAGAAAGALAHLIGAAIAELQLLGAGDGVLRAPTGAAAGELVFAGAGAGTLGALTASGTDGTQVIIDTIRVPGRVRHVVRLQLRVRPAVRCDGRVARSIPLELAVASRAVVPARVRTRVLVGLDP